MTPETDGLPSQVWRDTVLVHEVRLPAVMPPSSSVDDYWRWRGYQPHPRAVDDMGAVTRATGPGGTSVAHRPGGVGGPAGSRPRFVCRYRSVRIVRPRGMPERIAISERDVRDSTDGERQRCISG